MSNIQILAKAEVLGAPVDAAYQKSDDGSSVMLVYGSPTVEKWVSLDELLTQLGQLVTLGSINKDTISNALPESIKNALEQIQFCVKTVYFLKGEVPGATPGAAPTEQKKSEYAFSIELTLGDLTDAFPIKVSSVSFKIWATANKQILDEMEITKIQNLLAASGQ